MRRDKWNVAGFQQVHWNSSTEQQGCPTSSLDRASSRYQIDFAKYPKEEDEASGVMYTDWTHWYVAPPGPRHDLGSCLSFADGHVEYIKWARGNLWGTFGAHASSNNTQANATADMLRLQAFRGY